MGKALIGATPKRYGGKGQDDRLAEGEAILRDRGHGMPLSALAEKYGLSVATVERRIDQALAARLHPTVDAYREQQDAVLDDVAQQWQRQLDTADAMVREGITKEQLPTVELGLRLRAQALDGMLRVVDRRAKLNGLDAPTRVEATVVHTSPVDAAIEELAQQIEAQASAAAGRG